MDEIAVLVLTYNHQGYIRKCLDSILGQVLPFEFKIYVVDDFSTDSTPKILKEYKNANPTRFEVTFNEYNHVSRNEAPASRVIRNIHVNFLAFCDGDDYWIDSFKLSKQLALLNSNSNVSLSHTDYFLGCGAEEDLKLERRNTKEILRAKKQFTADDLLVGTYIKQSTVVVRMKSIDLNFIYSSASIAGLDGLFYVSAGQKGNFSFLDTQTTVHRIHELSLFNSTNRASREKLKDEFRWYCASNLPEGLLRNQFREQVVRLHLRHRISTSFSYRVFRPIVLMARSILSKIRI